MLPVRLTVEVAAVRHAGESFAFRVAGSDGSGAGIVYSGDCADPDDLLPLLRPGDTLLAEATFGPGPVPPGMPHLDGPTAGRLATAAGAGALLLTHLRMGCDPGGDGPRRARPLRRPRHPGWSGRPFRGVSVLISLTVLATTR